MSVWGKVMLQWTRLVSTWIPPRFLKVCIFLWSVGWRVSVSLCFYCDFFFKWQGSCVSYVKQILNAFHLCITAEHNHSMKSGFSIFTWLCLLKWKSPDLTEWLYSATTHSYASMSVIKTYQLSHKHVPQCEQIFPVSRSVYWVYPDTNLSNLIDWYIHVHAWQEICDF